MKRFIQVSCLVGLASFCMPGAMAQSEYGSDLGQSEAGGLEMQSNQYDQMRMQAPRSYSRFMQPTPKMQGAQSNASSQTVGGPQTLRGGISTGVSPTAGSVRTESGTAFLVGPDGSPTTMIPADYLDLPNTGWQNNNPGINGTSYAGKRRMASRAPQDIPLNTNGNVEANRFRDQRAVETQTVFTPM